MNPLAVREIGEDLTSCLDEKGRWLTSQHRSQERVSHSTLHRFVTYCYIAVLFFSCMSSAHAATQSAQDAERDKYIPKVAARGSASDVAARETSTAIIQVLHPTCKYVDSIVLADGVGSGSNVRQVVASTEYKCPINAYRLKWVLMINKNNGYIYNLRILEDTSPVPSASFINVLDKVKARLGLGLWK